MQRQGKKILVVEDEKPLALALEVSLTKQGHKVTVAEDGQQAVTLITKGQYDAVVLDLMMPIMDGFEVLETVGRQGKLPPTLVLSNMTQPEHMARVMELGARKFLVKSDTSLDTIAEEVNRL